MTPARPALRVDRVRLANARAGDRARLAQALAMASPAATGVADRALLLVRRMRVDRPLAAGAEGFAGELIDRIRAAKTSARQGVMGAGDSLYFEDETALEQAIVAATLDGAKLPELVRRAIPDSEAPQLRWRRRILSDARKLPALIMALAEAGIAGAWLERFDEGELRSAAELLLRTYGSVASLPGRAGEERRAVKPAAVPRDTGRMPAAIVEAAVLARSATPAPAPRLLITVAALAARRPELVATQALADTLDMSFDLPASPLPSARARQLAATASPPAKAMPAPARSAGPEANAALDRRPTRAERSSRRRTATAVARQSAASGAAAARAPEPHRAMAPAPISAASMPGISASVPNAYAGLFFLLNVFLALGLYGDFTEPVRRVRGLSPFELLLLLARRWIGADFAHDPLDAMLRDLAGLGPRERAGRNFEAPAWQAPPDWLAPWPAAVPRKVRSREGVSHWHAAGFPIADQWRDERPAAWLRRRWVANLARYIEARLARALGSVDAAGAVDTLLRRPGTVRIDNGQIEIAFALDTHPLAIRLAGLDRDLGWIPAAGHMVGFRFA